MYAAVQRSRDSNREFMKSGGETREGSQLTISNDTKGTGTTMVKIQEQEQFGIVICTVPWILDCSPWGGGV